jgi:glycyl-tRNA synthetase beta chain
MPDFLLEIGTEEIPAGMIPGMMEDLASRMGEALEKARLAYDSLTEIGAPRRVGLLIRGLPARQEDRTETVTGPPMAVARDDKGNWTRAAEGFARKQDVDLDLLEEVEGAKGPCAGFTRRVQGLPVGELLAAAVPNAVESLHLPKSMRWGQGGFTFVRPVRWVLALLDEAVVSLKIKGVASGRVTRGHRLHGKGEISVSQVQDYLPHLEREHVLPLPEGRRRRIRDQLSISAASMKGTVEKDDSLLETVVFAAEYPSVVTGKIPNEYLALPPEILVTCLREHQKFFAVRDSENRLLPAFLSIVDAPSDPKGLIRKGNENVTDSRLSDARFFYEHDRAVPLDSLLNSLQGITFHPKIGTYYDKVLRMEAYAERLAPHFGASSSQAARAARLCKCDLATQLVQEKEFTGLQGIAGGLYAAEQGEPSEIVDAIRSQYDTEMLLALADTSRATAVSVALADRLDTLIEFFKIGQIPTGSKDPFALRRAAQETVEILASQRTGGAVHLENLIEEWAPAVSEQLLAFFDERARHLWQTAGYPYDEVNAVMSENGRNFADMKKRLEAVHEIRNEFPEDFDALSVAFKRAGNILKGMPPYPLEPERFLPESDQEGAGERALCSAYSAVKDEAEEALRASRYADTLRLLAGIRPAVDRFFDDVLVMCDPEGKDPRKTALQQNRIALLQGVAGLFNRIADLSEIVPAPQRDGGRNAN